MPGYLFKLPSAFLSVFGIKAAAAPADEPQSAPSIRQLIGDSYRSADENAAVGQRDPFAVDPALVERGVQGHAKTQNAVAEYLQSILIEPVSPRGNEPNFDVAWRVGDRVFVAEVKSLTVANEEKQLRLGLGQVLRYAQQLGDGVVPVLVAERAPKDPTWEQLCARVGVILVWPDLFAERLK